MALRQILRHATPLITPLLLQGYDVADTAIVNIHMIIFEAIQQHYVAEDTPQRHFHYLFSRHV